MVGGIVLGIVAVVAVTVLLTLLQLRKRNEAWTATVVKVEEFAGRRQGSPVRVNYIRVIYQRADGTLGKFENTAAAFVLSGQSVAPGDWLVKEKGQFAPRIVKAGAPPGPPPLPPPGPGLQ